MYRVLCPVICSMWMHLKIHYCHCDEISVTRLGKILPLFQKFTILWQIFDCSFLIWQDAEPTLENLWHYWVSFHCCKWPNIEKYITIWSHWMKCALIGRGEKGIEAWVSPIILQCSMPEVLISRINCFLVFSVCLFIYIFVWIFVKERRRFFFLLQLVMRCNSRDASYLIPLSRAQCYKTNSTPPKSLLRKGRKGDVNMNIIWKQLIPGKGYSSVLKVE